MCELYCEDRLAVYCSLVIVGSLCYISLCLGRPIDMRQIRQILARGVALPLLIIFVIAWAAAVGPIRWYGDVITGTIYGLIVMGVIGVIFFFLALWLIGPHVLPIDTRERRERSSARRVLNQFALGTPTLTAVVREGKVLDGPDGKPRAGTGGTGVIDVDSTSIVGLATDTGLSRLRGQGVVFTSETEKIGPVIDLRIQLRSDRFEYTTRDGILIKTNVAVRFQIDQVQFVKVQEIDRSVLRWPRPLSWTPRTIKRALGLQTVGKEGQTKWDDMPLGVAAGMLRGIIAEYTFDQLTEPLEPRKDPRSDIKARLNKAVKAALAPSGINVLSVSVGIFFPAGFDQAKAFDQNPKTAELDKITQQRVKAWRAEWESRMIRINAEAEAEVQRRRALARTQAYMDLIMRVTQALEQGAPAIADSTDQVARRFLETLQKIADEQPPMMLGENVQIMGLIAPKDTGSTSGSST